MRPRDIPRSINAHRKELLTLNISARITSGGGAHSASVETSGVITSLRIPAKAQGAGSSVNGGELLFLALATCFCNDVYREAAKRDLVVDRVEVDVNGEFDADGAARNIRYRTEIASNAPRDALANLVRYVDQIAEIHRAVRTGTPVELAEVTIHAGAVP
jgi:organic hydroperoxide reductase OsmC/OhrA